MAVGDELDSASEKINNLKTETGYLLDAVTSIGATIKVAIEEAIESAEGLDKVSTQIAKTYSRDIIRSVSSLSIGLDKQIGLQERLNKGQDISKELLKIRESQELKHESIRLKILNLKKQAAFEDEEGQKLLYEQMIDLQQTQTLNNEILEDLKRQNSERSKSLGITGKLASGLDGILKKIDSSGQLSKVFNIGEVVDGYVELNNKTGENIGGLDRIKNLGSSIKNNLDLQNVSKVTGLFLLKKSFDLYKQYDALVTSTQNTFGDSRKESSELNRELQSNTSFWGKWGVTLKGQQEGIAAINKGLGIASKYNTEMAEGASEALLALKLSEEAVGGIGRQSLLSGKSIKQTSLDQSNIMTGVEKEYGIRLSLRSVMEEANKTSGQLLLNTMNLPGGITKAVSIAKSLGAEFKEISNSLKGLLDFENSITSELEAELLIGRDLNLEKARSYVLQGDNVNAMKEIVAQAGSLEELQGMNVIAQDALAASLGMSSDQLSEMLLNQGAINTQLDKTLDRKGEEVLANASALSIQEKMNQSMENLNATLSTMLWVISGIATIGAVLATIATGGAFAPIAATIIGSIGAVGTGMAYAGAVQDGVAPSSEGPFKIQDKFGATTITSKGDHLAVSPNLTVESNPINKIQPPIQHEVKQPIYQQPKEKYIIPDNKDAKETNSLLKQILQKQGVIKMDATNVGTAFSVNTYQVQ